MEQYQTRVIEEKKELDIKLHKLTCFISTDTFDSLSDSERERIYRQERYMELYSTVLADRIKAFKNKVTT